MLVVGRVFIFYLISYSLVGKWADPDGTAIWDIKIFIRIFLL